MAKKKTGRELVKLSTGDGLYTYHTSRKRGESKLQLKKYNPRTKTHQVFVEKK